MIELAIGAIIAALVFDFLNGFHDAANSIATVVGTRVLRPLQAVALAAIGNFIGPFLFGVAVATTIGKGIIDPNFVTLNIIIGALVGAIIWDIITWLMGLPTSSSHALIGGIIGAGIAGAGTQAIIFGGLQKVVTGIVISPVVGLVVAFSVATLLITAFAKRRPSAVNSVFGRLQIISSTYFSLTHGANDGQKTMEVRITQLKPYQGFAAETGGATILAILAWLGIPASTTHAISGAIMGAGAVKRVSAVRWGIGRRIVWAWIITIPASAAVAYASTLIIKAI